MQDLSSLTWDQICVPAVETWSLNHWITREVPIIYYSFPSTFLPYSHLFYYKNVYFPKLASHIDVFRYFIEHTCPTAVWVVGGGTQPG